MREILTKSVMLPTAPSQAARLSPKITLIYGVPKVGKTEILTKLPGCLIMDTEDGTAMYDCLRVPINSADDFYNFAGALRKEIDARKAAGKTGEDIYPYKYIAIDTLDKLEEYAEHEATRVYKKSSVCGKEFKETGVSVVELPHGLGYYYLRTELLKMVGFMTNMAAHLILIVHVKEKLITDKKGEQVKVNDISLTGKLGSMVCAKADAIGYIFRDVKNNLMISFETSEGHVMGTRQKHLAGRKIPFDWAEIFIDDQSLKK